MTETSALESQIAELIRDSLQVDIASPTTDLIDSGLLDSLALISLIAEIELEFDFQLPLDDFDVERFRDVRRIATFVAEHRPDIATGGAA